MNVLEIRNLQKNYKGFRYHIDLTINENETLGLVGPNGAGKTTTVNIIMNIVKKESGDVKIFNMDHIKYEKEIKKKIGFVFEEQNFYNNMKIEQIIHFCAPLYPMWDGEYCSITLEKFNLPLQKKYGELSKGMKTKLALLIALSSGGRLLILDEATSGLDPKMRHEVLNEIEQIKERNSPSILFCSHLMQDVERISDRIALINNGKITLAEKKEDLKRKWKKIKFINANIPDYQSIPNILRLQQNENLRYLIITNNFSSEFIQNLESMGCKGIEIEDLSLEEIFLECVSM